MLTPLIAYWDKYQVCHLANKAHFDWFGYEPSQLDRSFTLKEFLGPVYETNLPYIQNVLKGENQRFIRLFNTPTKGIRAGLTHYTADIQGGEVKGFYVHVSDISKEQKLDSEQKRVSEILDKSSEIARIGTWEVDLILNKIHWSPMIRQIYEVGDDYEPELVSAINFFKKGKSRDTIIKHFNDAVNFGKTYDVEVILITGKGKQVWVRAIGQPEFQGEFCNRVYGVFQDIDQIKKAEIQKNRLLKITNEQNGRLKNFAHIVSHNLRSHSTNIYNLLKLFLEINPLFETDELITLLTGASESLKSTIENLNEVVSINTNVANLECIILRQVIESAISNLSHLIKEHNIIINNHVEVNHDVMGIPAYMDSIIVNFLSNAIKYRSPKRNAIIEFKTETTNNHVSLYITDNGLGIDLERYGEKIFGMYKTFHSNKDSQGIGLFITKNQIEAMGGSVSVESVVDVGSIFKITFKNE